MTGRSNYSGNGPGTGPLIYWRDDYYDSTFDFTVRFTKYDMSVMPQKVAFAHFSYPAIINASKAVVRVSEVRTSLLALNLELQNCYWCIKNETLVGIFLLLYSV